MNGQSVYKTEDLQQWLCLCLMVKTKKEWAKSYSIFYTFLFLILL